MKTRSKRHAPTQALAVKLERVRILLCDVDGVLTDGSVSLGDGREFKQFYVQDGLGLRLLQGEGIKVGWVSNRPSPATRQRAEELKIDFLYQDKGNKVEAAETILAQAGLTWRDVCYVGDDVVDLGVLKRAGAAIAVANAIEEVKALADYVTTARGGGGAVREVVELILRAQGRWERLVRRCSA